MDYIKPNQVVANMAETGGKKTNLSSMRILVSAMLSGAFLGLRQRSLILHRHKQGTIFSVRLYSL